MKKSVKAFLLVVALLLPSVSHAQTTAYTTTLLSYGPSAYWPMNETNGDTAYDIADNPEGTNNGTYSSENEQNDPALFILGQPGPGYLFGTNTSVNLNPPDEADYYGNAAMVAIPDEPDLNSTGPVTIIAWIQDTISGTFATIIGNSDQSYHIDVDQNGFAHFADGNGEGDTVAIGASAVNDGAWHQLVGVWMEFLRVPQRAQPRRSAMFLLSLAPAI
jgi:Concanavalin A-like lectin/glucanases superfamily